MSHFIFTYASYFLPPFALLIYKLAELGGGHIATTHLGAIGVTTWFHAGSSSSPHGPHGFSTSSAKQKGFFLIISYYQNKTEHIKLLCFSLNSLWLWPFFLYVFVESLFLERHTFGIFFTLLTRCAKFSLTVIFYSTLLLINISFKLFHYFSPCLLFALIISLNWTKCITVRCTPSKWARPLKSSGFLGTCSDRGRQTPNLQNGENGYWKKYNLQSS